MIPFKDYFSDASANYAKFRPHYPKALFEYLASLCPEHSVAWDAATGNGQTANALVDYFKEVIATDASTAQIASAKPHPKIRYQVMPSEKTDFLDETFDLVTASAALHWFDFDTFYPELKRVLKPKGVFAAWCYNQAQVSPRVDLIVNEMYWKVHSVWPKERVYVDENYKTIPFLLEEIDPPKFDLNANWNFAEYKGYLNTWSGVKSYLQIHGLDSLDSTWQKLFAAWGDPTTKLNVNWLLHLRVGHK